MCLSKSSLHACRQVGGFQVNKILLLCYMYVLLYTLTIIRPLENKYKLVCTVACVVVNVVVNVVVYVVVNVVVYVVVNVVVCIVVCTYICFPKVQR